MAKAEEQSQTTFVIESTLPWESGALRQDGALDCISLYRDGTRQNCYLRDISALGATVNGERPLEPGTEVALELPTGHRPAAIVDWVNGTDAGLRFKHPINVIPLINRQLLSQPVERRRMPRVELRCRAWIEADREFFPATVRNISAGGFQVESQSLPSTGADVRIFVEGLNVPPGRLVWKNGDIAGIELKSELAWATVILWLREFARIPENPN